MGRSLALTAALAASLAAVSTALAQQAGHNGPTRALEAAFKTAQFERAHSDDGCYPAPRPLANEIRAASGRRTGVAKSFGKVRRSGVIFVIKRKASCDHVNLALRARGSLWILDSTKGTVGKPGAGVDNTRDRAEGGKGPLRALRMRSKTLTLNETDEVQRGEVGCPGKLFPLGGGLTPSSPPLADDGEGIYPHSFERLGAQRGWHVNPVLIDPAVIANPTNPGTVPRRATIQVICGKGLVASSGPRKSIFLRPGESGTATSRCPGGQVLIAGGFQRTNFRTPGGNYVTESRAVGRKKWRVSGSAFGNAGGELTAIAYCDRSKKRLLTEVSATASVPGGGAATATTPTCPRRRQLTSGGFSFNGSILALFAAGYFNPDRTWSVQGYGYFGPAPAMTAYGYCLRTKSRIRGL
ncbi:MAG: hypothetical protein ACRDKH_02965 [Solirubrobacterales bacterium]